MEVETGVISSREGLISEIIEGEDTEGILGDERRMGKRGL